jgi:hypothetical protein
LHIVEALRVSLPDVDFGATDWFAIDVFDGAQYEKWLSTRVSRDGTAVVAVDGVVGMKWAEDCAICTAFWLRVIDGVDQQGETQNVRKKNEFLKDGH